MNRQLYNNAAGRQKKGRKGCLFLIVGCFATIAATLVFVVTVLLLTRVTIESRHGGEAAYALLTAFKSCYPIVFSLFLGILALWYMAPTEAEVQAQRKGLSPMLGQKETHAMSAGTKWLITGALLAGVLVTGAVAVNTYRLVTPDGIRTYCFVETKSYEWKQVTAYTIDCDDSNGLSVTFTMRDGKKFEILQGVNSTTEKFDEQYTSVTHYAYDVDLHMVELEVPRNVRHMERAVKFYQDREGLWPYVSRLIGYVELVPEPDETAEITEAPTEASTETTAAAPTE
jgi:hypothetical protein